MMDGQAGQELDADAGGHSVILSSSRLRYPFATIADGFGHPL